jgi:hypothetical protein
VYFGCITSVFRVYYGCITGVLRMYYGCITDVLRGYPKIIVRWGNSIIANMSDGRWGKMYMVCNFFTS